MSVGEFILESGDIEFNKGITSITLKVKNTADRGIQVGSHYHFYEVNPALSFDRKKAYGMHLEIPPGTSIRLEPGEEREVTLIPYQGKRVVFGFRQEVMGELDK